MTIAWERRGSGDSLLLIQGLGYARWGWEPVLEPLAERFDVLAFDNRGIGESDAPAGPYSAAELAQDALAVLDRAGVERAHVLGTSLGGMVAQELALAAPERVRRLVLASTTPGGESAWPMPQVTVDLMLAGASPREYVVNALQPDPDPELVERVVAHRERTAQTQEAWAAQAAAGMTFDASGRLGELEAPTLVLHGDADTVVDCRNAELLAQLIPDARVEVIPDGSHLFFWQRPEALVEPVVRFLA